MANIHVRIDDKDYEKFKKVYKEVYLDLGLPPIISEFYRLITYAFIRSPKAFTVKLGDDNVV